MFNMCTDKIIVLIEAYITNVHIKVSIYPIVHV